MKLMNYSDLKPGMTYLYYNQKSRGKGVYLFNLLDSKVVNESFSIINIQYAIHQESDLSIRETADTVRSLFPHELVFSLTEDEIINHLLLATIWIVKKQTPKICIQAILNNENVKKYVNSEILESEEFIQELLMETI